MKWGGMHHLELVIPIVILIAFLEGSFLVVSRDLRWQLGKQRGASGQLKPLEAALLPWKTVSVGGVHEITWSIVLEKNEFPYSVAVVVLGIRSQKGIAVLVRV